MHPQDARPGTGEISKFAYIDLLRGLAILGVVAVHSMQQVKDAPELISTVLNFGDLGVQLFFVASALTLCLSMSGRREASPWNFYVRRFFRIAPLFYLGIPLYFCWRAIKEAYHSGRLGWPEHYEWLAVAENLLFVHGFHPRNYNFVVPGGWSISTEMAFYAIFPLLFWVQSRLPFGRLLAVAAAAIAGCLLVEYALIRAVQPWLMERGILKQVYVNDGFGFMYCSLLNQLGVFIVGIVTFRCLGRVTVAGGTLAFALALAVVSGYLLSQEHHLGDFNGFFYPLLAAMAFAILALRLSTVGAFEGALPRAVIRVGQVSYSMYLLHFLVMDVLKLVFRLSVFRWVENPEARILILFASIVAVTYMLAVYAYRWIEKPGIDFGRRFLRPAAGTPA